MGSKNRLTVGYTAGVYDLFHIGHLNLLKRAKEMCDVLIVGVTTDDLASYKKVIPFINENERMEIVRCVRYVDAVVPQHSLDKFEAWKKIRYDVIFVGSDWQGTPEWNDYQSRLEEVGARVVYLPYTQNTSSTKLRGAIDTVRDL